jgi:hypothetical protein
MFLYTAMPTFQTSLKPFVYLTALFLSLVAGVNASAKQKHEDNAMRCDPGAPSCTFIRGNDGKYRYKLTTPLLNLTMAIDSQELQLSRKRPEPMFTVFLAVHSNADGRLDVIPNKFTLEFADHAHALQHALDPDALSTELQALADDLSHQTERELRKHPEKKEELEKQVAAHEKDVSELQDFLGTHSLRMVTLGSGTHETSGWIYFSTRNRWIGGWKKQESLILRLPLGSEVYEFPFKLPPNQGDLILRQRPGE